LTFHGSSAIVWRTISIQPRQVNCRHSGSASQ
jgi:hypothetical protein